MNDFYEILDLFYKVNKKYPIYTFGQLIEYLHNKNVENLEEFKNDDFIKRLKIILEDEV
jgi:hypothetical protein